MKNKLFLFLIPIAIACVSQSRDGYSAVPPNAPTYLNATKVSDDRIDLEWDDTNSDPDPKDSDPDPNMVNETGFNIERKLGSSGIYQLLLPEPDSDSTVGANVTTYSDTGLLNYRTYFYRVMAYNKDADVGDGPLNVAVSPDQSTVYVTNNGDNTVTVINTDDYNVETVVVGNGPYGLAVSPDGSTVYVANNVDDTVSVIDTSDNSVVATVDVGDGPSNVAITPAGDYVYVTNFFEIENDTGTVSVIDTSDNSVAATVNVKPGPLELLITPAGDFVYVANNSSDTVSVIDTSDNTVVATVTVGFGPFGLAITPAGDFVYVANNLVNSVSVIDTSINSVVATVDVGGAPAQLAITPAGDSVYVTNNAEHSVSVIDTSGNSVVETIDVGFGPLNVTVLPDGDYVYITDNASNTVSVIDTSNNTLKKLVIIGDRPFGLAVVILPGSPEYVYVANNTGNSLSVIDTSLIDTDDNPVIITIDGNSEKIPNEDGLEVITKKSTSSSCFIATAVYRSSTDPHVQVLRKFRDTFLLTNTIGKGFVTFYYTYSPKVASLIVKSNTLRAAARSLLLPVVGLSWIALKLGPAATVTLMILFLVLTSTTIAVFLKNRTA